LDKTPAPVRVAKVSQKTPFSVKTPSESSFNRISVISSLRRFEISNFSDNSNSQNWPGSKERSKGEVYGQK
jgi:hypothetical protein